MSSVGNTHALGRELGALVGAEHVQVPVGEGSPYNRDATGEWRGLRGRADAVVRPRDPAEVAAVVGWCYRHGVALIPRGGGTGVAGGATPVDGGVVCSLERLRRVRELEPALWRMHVEAGLRTSEVQRLAR
ncbi:MAG: FAD-binding protein, partial [Solirubrobacterales bacterium]|nr:FAD-binding protein [Solirubrobacterales bacterium]